LNACKSEKSNNKKSDSLAEERLYLGQKPPGIVPEPFAPGLVTTDGWENCGGFTPDLKEFYFLREVKEKDENNKMELMVIENSDNQVGNGGWSEIKELAPPFDSLPTMRLTVSSKGTYFFDEFKRDFTGDIHYSRIVDGKYEEPKLLNKKINTGKSFHPFIAPDESYLIFDSKREGGYGDSDIYICFRLQNGSWGDPINLGEEINTEAWEASASVTPDGKYLFFNRNMGSENYENVDIFWVSMQVVEDLRQKSKI